MAGLGRPSPPSGVWLVGTVRTETEQHLSTLGVDDHHELKALQETVHTYSIEYTVKILQVHKEPSSYATVTETRKRKAMQTPKRRKYQKRSKRRKGHQHGADSSTEDWSSEVTPQSGSQPCHSMRTRSSKRVAHDADLHGTAAPELQRTRRRRITGACHAAEPSAVISTLVVNDSEEFHMVICRNEGCRQRPSPQKRAHQRDPDGGRPRKRICCTLCACATTVQSRAERPGPRELD